MVMNKKALAPQTTGELILVIAGGVVGLIILFAVLSPMFPVVGHIGCGANIAIYASTVELSNHWAGAPIFLCNQYREPVKINAADFGACPGIAGFCKGTKERFVKDECYKQCARIQIDKLTDACWSMGGQGQKDLKGVWYAGIGTGVIAADVLSNIAANIGAGFAWIGETAVVAAGTIFGPVLVYVVITGDMTLYNRLAQGTSFTEARDRIRDMTLQKTSIILRCNKFQVINPALDSYGRAFIFEDATWGNSQDYGIQGDVVCKNFGLRSPCYFGGTGVAAAQLNNETGSSEIDPYDLWKLEYDVSTARQVCYISYHQYCKDCGGNEKRYAIERDCGSWAPLGGNFKYLN